MAEKPQPNSANGKLSLVIQGGSQSHFSFNWIWHSSSFPRQHQGLLQLQTGCVDVLWLTQLSGTQTPASSVCVETFLQQSHARLPVPALLM